MTPSKFSSIAEAENTGESYETHLTATRHKLVADEPEELGGKDLGPTPGDYLCMSLASCKAITLRMYIQRKKWDVESIRVKVSLALGTITVSGINTFYSEISVKGNLTSEQLQRLNQIATKCPISKLLVKESEVISSISNANDSIQAT